ncbi:hypothetical protein BJF79_45890 [Actinomadura sp. CNU-125]|nr:hypothetical protein BJF79_45890 [Actinomadura sp. CNU-125]
MMSPDQPMRSSRAGVSVGMLRKLPRWPHVMLLWSRSSIFSPVLNDMVNGSAVCMTRPVTASRPGVPG